MKLPRFYISGPRQHKGVEMPDHEHKWYTYSIRSPRVLEQRCSVPCCPASRRLTTIDARHRRAEYPDSYPRIIKV